MNNNDENSGSGLLADDEGPAAEVINPGGTAPVILICEHASNFIPRRLEGLGLEAAARQSHAAWDPGALALAQRLSSMLDAPLVVSRVSRLVYDCNRPPDAPDAMPGQSELIEVPGNRDLSDAARRQREVEVYHPFHEALAGLVAERSATDPALVSIHSFTPVFFGVTRDVELGLLHGDDDRLAQRMLASVPTRTTLCTELNVPYGPADGVLHTLDLHARPRGLHNVMIEVRNDLIQDDNGVDRVAADLLTLLKIGLRMGEPSGAPDGKETPTL